MFPAERHDVREKLVGDDFTTRAQLVDSAAEEKRCSRGMMAATARLGNRVVTPSLILRKLGATPRQSALSLALREIGRIERTIHTLDWIVDKGLRADTTDELNKGEALGTTSGPRRRVPSASYRFRDRNHDQQSHRAAALNLVTACIGLFNCRYLGRAVDDLRRRGVDIDDKRLRRLSPLGWDHINLTGDYVWSAM